MAAIQLNFSLRTSSNCKTVHLLGSWDNYNGQLPLSKDSSKAGGWKGTFRFQGSTLKQGQRYWYYYIIDGYHVSHDPAREFTTEPTTGRKLNILDIPAKGSDSVQVTKASKRASRRVSADIPKGRSLSPSQIVSPRPVKPNQTRNIVAEKYEHATVEAVTARFNAATLEGSDDDDDEEEETDSDYSDNSSDVPSLTSRSSRSSGSSSPSSVSSRSSCCTCERYGITRKGERVKLDCGGARCGYSDESDCSSDSDNEYRVRMTRRQGMVVN
ncbi:hypothetical protein BDY21DRAFT_374783 [Lineolata rhizophorae]|uniref:GTP-binding protein EsdC n=1 Tax=Lineolata rhizophorae TaxID=578093 RepID=A0A6A6NQ49_9PEZI|nr:hypothetical protein BDY21DRAFT_374783 [Lineolata rhizophorae]